MKIGTITPRGVSTVSILILNHNGFADTVECVNSIKKNTEKNYEILILDNGSQNNEYANLKNTLERPTVRIFKSKHNLGFTGGNNLLLKKARSKIIMLLNNDTIVTRNWLKNILKTFDKSKKVAVVQPKIKYYYKRDYFDYAGAAGGFLDIFGYPFTRGRIFSSIEKDTGQYNNETPIFWASGAACAIKKSAIKKAGGLFKQQLFNYMEEIDFCWRVHNNKGLVYYSPKSVVYHKVASTAKKYMFKKRLWEHRNNLLLLSYNLNPKDKIKVLFPRLVLEMATYPYYLFTGNFRTAISLLAAHVDFLVKVNFKNESFSSKKMLSELPIYKKSIIFQYFIKQKKYFSNLQGN